MSTVSLKRSTPSPLKYPSILSTVVELASEVFCVERSAMRTRPAVLTDSMSAGASSCWN